MTVDIARGDLLELAERCEQATGPDRELDIAIGIAALGWKWIDDEFGYDAVLDFGAANSVGWNRAGPIPDCIPSPTSSLDVARKIVPEGREFQVTSARYCDGGYIPFAHVFRLRLMDTPEILGTSELSRDDAPPTVELALCAAALRARALQESSHDRA